MCICQVGVANEEGVVAGIVQLDDIFQLVVRNMNDSWTDSDKQAFDDLDDDALVVRLTFVLLICTFVYTGRRLVVWSRRVFACYTAAFVCCL